MSADTTTVREIVRRMDGERLILVPLLSGLLFLNVVSTVQHLTGTEAFGAHEVLTAIYKSLIVGFYVLLLVLLLIRTKAKDTRRNWRGTVMAYFGTFAPMMLLGVAGTGSADPVWTLASIVIMTAGMAFSVYAVAHLGRSFGAVPRARDLVRSGPYGVVRHPLYVGEIVTFFGAILVDLSAYKVAVFLLLVAVQAYRATQEEKVLTEVFPEYTEYAATTSRFIPRVV
jgi:protein-S-isoprenylcysteine O-methyltransferase Ste14